MEDPMYIVYLVWIFFVVAHVDGPDPQHSTFAV